MEQSNKPGHIIGVAEAAVRRARLAVLTGRLDAGASQLATAKKVTTNSELTLKTLPFLLVVEGQWMLTVGDFSQAEARFSDARNQAEGIQEPLYGAEALLGLARTFLSRKELEAASATFLEAGRQFQLIESTDGDGAAMLGVAQTLIGQEQWDEAIEHCEGALVRFRQVDDQLGQADAQLALGLAHEGNDELNEALNHYDQALTMYQEQQQPLGESDTHYERGGILQLRGDLDGAADEFSKAIALVERVLKTLSTPQLWSIFLRQYAELYAQAIINEVRRNADEQARELLISYVRIADLPSIEGYLKAYEDSLPTSGENLTEEEIRTNKDLIKRLRQLRKGL
jgi:tetratricopeptide (TPR) repeat protein